jgi:hypothetical protein
LTSLRPSVRPLTFHPLPFAPCAPRPRRGAACPDLMCILLLISSYAAFDARRVYGGQKLPATQAKAADCRRNIIRGKTLCGGGKGERGCAGGAGQQRGNVCSMCIKLCPTALEVCKVRTQTNTPIVKSCETETGSSLCPLPKDYDICRALPPLEHSNQKVPGT